MADDESSISTHQIRRLHAADYVLFGLTLAVSAAIGFYYAIKDRRRQNTADFMLAGRQMHVLPVALSLGVTFMSALTLLGTPAEMYNYNTMYMWLMLSHLLAMAIAAVIFIPFFYELKLTSTFEYLEMRFNKTVRMLGSVLFLFQTNIYMAFVLYPPSLALNAVTDLDLWGSVVAVGAVVTLYTALGGMKAVVVTDAVQAFLIFAGLLAVLIQGSIVNGGFANAWRIASNRSRIVYDEFSFDPATRHSFWSVVVGGGLFWVSLYGVNQSQVQRAISCSSVRKAQLALWLNLPVLWFIVGVTCLTGIVMFAFYSECDPISFGVISKTDELLPLFVMDTLGSYPGVPGIFLACLFSGSLSSLSSGLNALSAVVMQDLFRPFCCRRVSESRATLYSKLTVLLFGGLSIALAVVVSKLGSVLQAAYTITSIINGPIFGLFAFGMFVPWGNSCGAFIGTLVSFALMLWIGMGAFVNRVRTPTSPTVTTGCNWNWTAVNNNMTSTLTSTMTSAMTSSMTSAVTSDPDTGLTSTAAPTSSDPFYPMYTLSYLYYTPAAMLALVVVGLIVSLITGRTRPAKLEPRLHVSLVDVCLPCLPRTLRRHFRCGVPYQDELEETKEVPSVVNDKAKGGKLKPPSYAASNPAFINSEVLEITKL